MCPLCRFKPGLPSFLSYDLVCGRFCVTRFFNCMWDDNKPLKRVAAVTVVEIQMVREGLLGRYHISGQEMHARSCLNFLVQTL
jgi:hypothetical protein